jgi:hemerythrin-like domain-containing protein
MALRFSAPDFSALDVCHHQTQAHLMALAMLVETIAQQGVTPGAQQQAQAIEQFFSETSRKHHLEEERDIFPELMASGEAKLVDTVRQLLQDHYWIEENWLQLAPQLRAIANGMGWPDEAEFVRLAQLFLHLSSDHIALEESLIYPESKARLAQALAAREARMRHLREAT